MGELKAICRIAKTGHGASTFKHAIDASTTKSNQLNIRLVDPGSNAPVSHSGQTVYVSARGEQLVRQWHGENQDAERWVLVVQEDSWTDKWVTGYIEEA